jgi:hypothetical protein
MLLVEKRLPGFTGTFEIVAAERTGVVAEKRRPTFEPLGLPNEPNGPQRPNGPRDSVPIGSGDLAARGSSSPDSFRARRIAVTEKSGH